MSMDTVDSDQDFQEPPTFQVEVDLLLMLITRYANAVVAQKKGKDRADREGGGLRAGWARGGRWAGGAGAGG